VNIISYTEKKDGGELVKNIEIGIKAPGFTLVDNNDKEIHLSDYKGKRIILLSLIRGFA